MSGLYTFRPFALETTHTALVFGADARLSGRAERRVFSRKLPRVAACAALLHRDTAKNALAKAGGPGKLKGMSCVLEIENALRQMPPEDRWEVARWLLDDLQEQTTVRARPLSRRDI